MLYVLVGENVYQRDEEISKLVKNRAVERIDGESLSVDSVGEVLAGQTLFSDDTIKIISNASTNTDVWTAVGDWIERGDIADVILVEQKIDKRTKTYKSLKDQASIIECSYWKDRERAKATSWLKVYVKQQGVAVPDELYDEMVERAIRPSDVSKDAVVDQQRLARAVSQMKHAEAIDRTVLDTVMAPSVHENVFGLLASALDGDSEAVINMLRNLRRDQDGHRLFGLIGSQVANLAGLVLGGDRSVDEVARDIGAHPYALQQQSRYRREIGRSELSRIVSILADADVRLKNSQADPWVLIEKALVEIAVRRKTSRS